MGNPKPNTSCAHKMLRLACLMFFNLPCSLTLRALFHCPLRRPFVSITHKIPWGFTIVAVNSYCVEVPVILLQPTPGWGFRKRTTHSYQTEIHKMKNLFSSNILASDSPNISSVFSARTQIWSVLQSTTHEAVTRPTAEWVANSGSPTDWPICT